MQSMKELAFYPLLVALLFAAGLAYGADDERPAAPPGMRVAYDVPYGTASNAQQLDILYFEDTAEPRPAIVMIHGGGWYTGDKGGSSTFAMMTYFVEAGYVALSINYRLADEAVFPAPVEDCKLAVRWLRAHAKDYGVDPARIGAIGGSAGGHLTAMLVVARPEDGLDGDGLAGYSSAIQAAVPVCGPFDLRKDFDARGQEGPDPAVVRLLGGSPYDLTDAATKASPITYVRRDLPPMLLIHGTDDKRVVPEQSVAFAKALDAVGAPNELELVEGGNHGMGIARTDAMLKRIVAFFDRHVRGGGAPAASMKRWQDAKFGMFVHWGPASLTGQEISWSRGGDRPGLPGLLPGKVPVEEYDSLYQRFNPTDFDAKQWVDTMHSAGMKYIVFTTKHHDGFCMFDSALTDYDIAASPYGRDLVAELAEACHDGGVGLGFYYSLPDWHHPDYLTDNHARYVEYLHGQVRELCTNYGDVDEIWFDGKGSGTAKTWGSDDLVRIIRTLQPSALINDRVWGATDFDTPEQVIGRFELGRPWESCITLGQQWSWKPDDEIKTADECIRLLILAVGGGGNLLLNVGPMPTGAIEPRQVERLEEIGAWLRHYGEAIYETRGGPYAPSYWGASTRRDNRVYLLVFNGWESRLELPPLERTIVSNRMLTEGTVDVQQNEDGLVVSVTPRDPAPPVAIVELTLDGPASGIVPKPSGLIMPLGTTATGSNVRRGEEHYRPDMAVDQSPLSRWATDDGVTEAWLEIHLSEPVTFDVIAIDEAFGSRIQAFELKALKDGEWKTFYTGTTVGRNWAARFDPITAQELRLDIIRATDGPTIRDIRLHAVSDDV